MSATTIFFNGRLISIPGSYTEVDASGLEARGLGALGIVAAVGTALGGKPYNEVDQSDTRANLQIATRSGQEKRYFRSGDLLEAAPLLFGAGRDEAINGGAQEVVFVKVNQSAASSASFDNADGEALVLTSADYGYHTTQINVEIAAGTNQGKLITIVFEDTTETFDDVGGDSVFELIYLSSTPAKGFTTITAAVSATALTAAFTRTQVGLDSVLTNPAAAGEVIECVSSSAADTAVQIRIYGTSATNTKQVETLTLTGTSPKDTTGLWNEFHGVEVISGTLVGTLTLRRNGAGLTITTVAPAGTGAAISFFVDMPMGGGALSVAADGATTKKLIIWGLSNAGAYQTEMLTLNGAGTVTGTATWSRIQGIAAGAVEAARTVTVSGTAINAVFANLPTIQKLADKINGLPGMTLTVAITNPTTFASTDLDQETSTSILSPASLTTSNDLAAIITKINNESQFVTAEKGAVGSGAPSNTTAPVFLSGGNEGSATPGQEGIPYAQASDWQAAFDLLKKITVNTIVPLTGDPAVHADLVSHLEYMAGVGRQERDAVVGLLNAGLTDVPTKTEAKSQIVDLNTRHVRAVAQAIERYDSAGERTEFLPPFAACIVAGMQAGAKTVGLPLTHKYANILKLRQDSTWSPQDDAEELIQAGLCMFETVDGVGRRIVRNITTHLSSSNIAFTEASVNQAVNYSVYNLRTTMEDIIGSAGFAGTANAAKGLAIGALTQLVGISLVSWRSLDIELILDVIEMGVEIAPVLPVNFVKTTVHLVSVPQSAAA